MEEKLAHLLGSITFTTAKYGIFENGRFYETETEEFAFDEDNAIEPKQLSKEEILAQKLNKKAEPVEALCFCIAVNDLEEKQQAMDVLSQINDLFPDDIFDVKFNLIERQEDLLPQYQAEYEAYEKEAADRKLVAANEIKAVLDKYKMVLNFYKTQGTNYSRYFNIHNYLSEAEDPDDIFYTWFGKTCTGTIKFIFKFDANRKSDFIKALDAMP